MKANYSEFSDPRLVAIYNTVCPLDGYEQFYIELAKKLSAKTILDIGCGTGLLTCELAKRGYNMIGIEPSNLMLDVARRSPHGEKVTWIQGDALSLGEAEADLAIMTGHVAQFYLDDDYWNSALKSINLGLRSGGYIAFESRNPEVQSWKTKKHIDRNDWYSPNYRRKVVDPVAGPLEIWAEITQIKDRKVVTDIHYLFTKTGKELLSRNELIFRSREEITQSLEKAGFSIENVYGDWNGSIATSESPEFIFVAKRK